MIGGHPHRLQGCGFTDGVPVAVSGNDVEETYRLAARNRERRSK
ncbi:hypothetical protein [Akkermansia sp.]